MRKVPFVEGEYYHIFNRGVDKRTVFEDKDDIERFFLSIHAFNSPIPTGSIYEKYFAKKEPPSLLGHPMSKWEKKDKLVDFVAYCLLPNHYHFILTPMIEHGIEKFMQKLGNGYTKFFNDKHKRSGALFQGRFKAVHIETNKQLLHVSAYINLNEKVHQFGSSTPKLVKSSWEEYLENREGVCNKDIVLGQFKSTEEFKKTAEETVAEIARQRQQEKQDDRNEMWLE